MFDQLVKRSNWVCGFTHPGHESHTNRIVGPIAHLVRPPHPRQACPMKGGFRGLVP